MILFTEIVEGGFVVEAVKDTPSFAVNKAHEIPSEHYLKAIEDEVDRVGGWEKIDTWYLKNAAESFTSLRGLVVLTNTLASIHDVEVFVYKDGLENAEKAQMPIEPAYSSEPNITKKT